MCSRSWAWRRWGVSTWNRWSLPTGREEREVHLLEHHSPCAWNLQREYVRRHPHGGCKRNVKPELAEAKGKRLIIAAELEEGMRLNTSVVKQMCSTDEIFAEKKYKDPFPYAEPHPRALYQPPAKGGSE